jgi:hypothetical protein
MCGGLRCCADVNMLAHMIKYKIAILLVSAVSFSAPSLALTTCTISQKQVCRPGVECEQTKNSIVVRIDWNQGTYSRCDAKGCDALSMQFAVSGDFLNIEVPGRGMLAKISKDGSSYVEVATFMTNVIVSFGSCKFN